MGHRWQGRYGRDTTGERGDHSGACARLRRKISARYGCFAQSGRAEENRFMVAGRVRGEGRLGDGARVEAVRSSVGGRQSVRGNTRHVRLATNRKVERSTEFSRSGKTFSLSARKVKFRQAQSNEGVATTQPLLRRRMER